MYGLATLCNDLERLPREKWDSLIHEMINNIGSVIYDLSALTWLDEQMQRLDSDLVSIGPSDKEIEQQGKEDTSE